MMDIKKRLRRAHDKLHCLVDIGGQKSSATQESEIQEARDLCWESSNHIEALKAKLAEAREALERIACYEHSRDLLWWQQDARQALDSQERGFPQEGDEYWWVSAAIDARCDPETPYTFSKTRDGWHKWEIRQIDIRIAGRIEVNSIEAAERVMAEIPSEDLDLLCMDPEFVPPRAEDS